MSRAKLVSTGNGIGRRLLLAALSALLVITTLAIIPGDAYGGEEGDAAPVAEDATATVPPSTIPPVESTATTSTVAETTTTVPATTTTTSSVPPTEDSSATTIPVTTTTTSSVAPAEDSTDPEPEVVTLDAVAAPLGDPGVHDQSDGQCVEDYVGSVNCTANDVLLASVENIVVTDGCDGTVGDTVTFTADFGVDLTSNARYDIGVWFATDGDPNGDGARTGLCTATNLPYTPDPPWLDLEGIVDGVQDTCGDIDSTHDPLSLSISLTVVCVDHDGDGLLDLPYMTTWDNTKAKTACTSALGTLPNTKAKCYVPPTTPNVPVPIPQVGTIEVIKDLVPASDPGLFNLQIDGVTQKANATDGGTTGAVQVSAGFRDDPDPIGDTHTVGEIAGTGTTLSDYVSSISCVDQEGDTASLDPGTGPLDIFVEPDDAWVCTITNTGDARIIVDKITNPSGDPQTFGFELDGIGNPTNQLFTLTDASTPHDSGPLDPGVYSVAEAVPAGWADPPTIHCENQDGVEDVDPGSLTLNAGETITCTFTNTQFKSDVQVYKTVEGVDDTFGWSFEFDLSPAATVENSSPSTGTGNGNGTQVSWNDLVPGTLYTLTETTQAGYNDGVLICEGITDTNPADNIVTFVAPIGDANDPDITYEVTCGITNTAYQSDLEVYKAVEGVDNTFGWSFEFDLSPAATVENSSPSTGTGNGQGTQVSWNDLVPGTEYVLTETTQAAYNGGVLICEDFTDTNPAANIVTFVAPIGDANDPDVTHEVFCEITNTAHPSAIEVTKTVEDIDAGLDWSFDFTLTPSTTPGDTSPATGTGPGTDTVSWTGLQPGSTYTVAETVPNDGYSEGALTCNVPDTDGNLTDQSVTFVAPPDDPAVAFEVTCGVTNTAYQSDLEVYKTVDDIRGSLRWSFDFTLTPSATPGDPSPATGTGPGFDTVTWGSLVPGTEYTVAETVPNDGYSEGALTCNVPDTDGDLTDQSVTFIAPLGDNNDPDITYEVICEITNTAYQSDVEVVKTVAGVDAGFAWSFDFDLSPAATVETASPSTGTGNNDGTQVSWNGLVPGESYTVAETTVAGYSAGALTCNVPDTDGDLTDQSVTFIAPLGDNNDPDITYEVICEITNTAFWSDLEVTKTVVDIDDGLDWSFDFTLTPSATPDDASPATGTGDGTDTVTWGSLVPGTEYTLTETTVAGYEAGALTCNVADTDGDLTDQSVTFIAPLGDNNDPDITYEVTCEITNTAFWSDLEVVKTVAGVDDGLDWSFAFTLTPAAWVETASPSTGTGNSDGTQVSWSELVPGTEYVLTETALVGYNGGVLSCTGVTDTNPAANIVTFLAPLGDANDPDVTYEVSCGITNTAYQSDLEVVKTVAGIDAGLGWSFDFTLTPDATTSDLSPATGTGPGSDTVSWTGLVPGGTYTVAETLPNAGYTEGALTCDVDDTDGDLTDQSVTFVAPLGDGNDAGITFEVNCSITNTADPSAIQVTKTVAGIDAGLDWSFHFSLIPAATPGDTSPATGTGPGTDTVSWTGLQPGSTYTVAETVPNDGYSEGALTCNVPDTDGNLTDQSVTFVAPADDLEVAFEVTCGITNTAYQSDLEVTKTVAGVDAGLDWSFGFTLTPAATVENGSPSTGTGNTDGTQVSWNDLVPGAKYVLTETTLAGYNGGVLSCTGINDHDPADNIVEFIAPLGDANDPDVTYEVSCGITNTAYQSDLEVTKTVDGVDAGFAWSFDFDLSPAASVETASPSTGTGNSDGTQVSWNDLVPGTEYVLTETTQAGYNGGVLSCTGVTDTNPAANIVTFLAPLGDANDPDVTYEVSCGITNTAYQSDLEVVKTVAGIDAGLGWSFDFTLTPDATTSDLSPATGTGPGSDTVSWTGLVPGGTYTVAETLPNAGYTEGALTCDVDDTDGDLTDQSVTFVAPLGDSNDAGITFEVNCAITNTADPSAIEVTKTVEDIDGSLGWSFGFTLSPAATVGDASPATGTGPGSDTVSWTGLVPGGTYTVAETVPNAGYSEGALTCNVPDTDGNLTDQSVTFVAPADDPDVAFEVTCGITNTAYQSDLEVIKTVAGVDAGLGWSFGFTLTPAATVENGSPSTGTGNNDGTQVSWNGLVPGGTYTVAETVPNAGYAAGALTCNVADTDGDLTDQSVTFVAPLGDANVEVTTYEVTCGITNTAYQSDLEVIKTVAGVDAGLDWSFGFTLTPAATVENGSPSTGTGNNDGTQVSWNDLIPGGTYTVAETVPNAGYSAGALTCNVDDTDGDLTDQSVTFVAPLGDSNDPTVTYEVSCGITNTAYQSDLEVVKTVAGIDAGLGWSFDFTLTPDATTSDLSPATGTGPGSDTVSWTGLVPGGTYTVAETLPNAGYTEGALTCDVDDTDGDLTDQSVTFVAPLGDSNDGGITFEVNCAITNTAYQSDLEVIKIVDGVDDTYAWSFDFDLSPAATVENASPSTGTGNSDGTQVSWNDLVPGTEYVLTETTLAGYNGGTLTCTGVTDTDTVDNTVTFEAPLGDANDPDVTYEVSCEITNTADPIPITLNKTTLGGDGTFEFTIVPDPTDASSPFSVTTVDGSGSDGPHDLVAGTTYTVTEVDPGVDWIAGELTCAVTPHDGVPGNVEIPFTVQPGDSVSCTVENTKRPTLTLDKVVINDHGGTKKADAWTLKATGDSGSISGIPTLDPTDDLKGSYGPEYVDIGVEYTLSETESTPPQYTQDGPWSCAITDAAGVTTTVLVGDEGAIATLELSAGDEAVCTVINDDDVAELTLEKVVVNDNGGTSVAADWTLKATSTSTFGDFSKAADQNTSTDNLTGDTDVQEVHANNEYTLSETGTTGYTQVGMWSCVTTDVTGSPGSPVLSNTITLDHGEKATCTATNDDDAPSLLLQKTVVNDNGGNGVAADWTLSAGTNTVTGSATPVEATNQTGTYPLTETTVQGYVNTSLTCSDDPGVEVTEVTIGLSETITCTFVNDDLLVGVDIEKSTNGHDADTPTGPYVPVGDAVEWEYEITNPGLIPLSDVVVTDDQAGVSPVYDSGDTNTDGLLDDHETWIYKASGVAVAGQYANIGTVTAVVGGDAVLFGVVDAGVGDTITDTDPSHYFGVESVIDIEKSTNGDDADTPTGPEILLGDPVMWEYVVTNTGNTPLANIVVTDDQAGVTPVYVSGDTNGDDLLDPTETWIYQATGVSVLGQYANIGTATGVDVTGATVTATDPSHYLGFGLASLGDTVWNDANGNGIQDGDPLEKGIAGAVVKLTLPDGTTLNTTTDADGKYLFTDLIPGTYTVELVMSSIPQPSEGELKLTTAGSFTLTLAAGDNDLDSDFGVVAVLPVTGINTGTILMIALALLLAGAAAVILTTRKRKNEGDIAA